VCMCVYVCVCVCVCVCCGRRTHLYGLAQYAMNKSDLSWLSGLGRGHFKMVLCSLKVQVTAVTKTDTNTMQLGFSCRL
jgi:hypothetical protein